MNFQSIRQMVLAGSALSLAGQLLAAPAMTPIAGSASMPHQQEARAEAVVVNTGEPRAYPNPWRSDRNQGTAITFDRMPMDSTLRIFTLSGQEVKTLDTTNGTVTWDRTNESGDQVASGIYLFLVTDILGQEFRGKLAIIR